MNVATSGVSARGWQEVKGSTRNTWGVGGFAGLRVGWLGGLEGLRVRGMEGCRVGGVEFLGVVGLERRWSGELGHSR